MAFLGLINQINTLVTLINDTLYPPDLDYESIDISDIPIGHNEYESQIESQIESDSIPIVPTSIFDEYTNEIIPNTLYTNHHNHHNNPDQLFQFGEYQILPDIQIIPIVPNIPTLINNTNTNTNNNTNIELDDIELDDISDFQIVPTNETIPILENH